MANVHFGNSGDVWKHLVLAEVLISERPHAVWESHAGSAWYSLRHTPPCDSGVYAFRQLAATSAVLAQTAYARLLRELAVGDALPRYPGSPYLAMRLCQTPPASLVFCDTDPESLANIEDVAIRLNIEGQRLRLVQDDGVSTLIGLGAAWPAAAAATTLVHIDPYDPLQASPLGLHAVDLFGELSARSMRCLLWAGYASLAGREALFEALRDALSRAKTTAEQLSLWCGDVDFTGIRTAGCAANPDVVSCLVLGSHLRESTCARCDALGHELARRYSPQATVGTAAPVVYTSYLGSAVS
jgi:23S rRNA A2030 N6-methylase RlmJ